MNSEAAEKETRFALQSRGRTYISSSAATYYIYGVEDVSKTITLVLQYVLNTAIKLDNIGWSLRMDYISSNVRIDYKPYTYMVNHNETDVMNTLKDIGIETEWEKLAGK